MPKKVPIISRDYLKDVPLPVYLTGRYTVIAHETIISFIEQEIENQGLFIENREFKAARGGQIATGKYHVKHADDPEIGLMIGFINSYDKTTRFGCTVGGFNKIYGNSYITSGNQTWVRKHTGNADQEAQDHIRDQITIASTHYDKIVSHRALFKKIELIPQLKASILGYLFFEKELLSPDQASAIIKNIKSQAYKYKGSTLWGLYNHITIALKNTHPLEWIKTQSQVHDILLNTYALNLSGKENNDDEYLPGQLDIFNEDSIDTFKPADDKQLASVSILSKEEVDVLYEEKDEVPLTDQHVVEKPTDSLDLDPGYNNAPQSYNLDDL